MSVYEQIASRTRSKRNRKPADDNKLDEQVEEYKDDDDDDDDDRSSVVHQVRIFISINIIKFLFYLVCFSTSKYIFHTSSEFEYIINSFNKFFNINT